MLSWMNHYLFVMFWASFTSALRLLFNFLELEENYQLETYRKWFKLFHSILIKLTSFRCMSRLVLMLSVIWFKVLRSICSSLLLNNNGYCICFHLKNSNAQMFAPVFSLEGTCISIFLFSSTFYLSKYIFPHFELTFFSLLFWRVSSLLLLSTPR